MKKFISVLIALTFTMAFSISTFAATESTDPQQAIETSIASDTSTDISTAAAEAKDDVVKKFDLKSFKGKFTGLLGELNKERAECKDLWNQLKASNQSIKTAWTNLKNSLKGKDKAEIKKILSDIKTAIDPIRQQAKTIHTDIKALRAQKTTQWTNFRTAVKARDEVKATTAMNSILSLKGQIIEKQKLLIPLKQQILALIK